jgi:anti-sigma-K factor RsiG
MDAQPDLALLSDAELKETIRRLTAQERELSRRRRLLHGRIELLKSELVGRLKGRDERELAAVDVDALSRILAGRLPDLDRLEGPVARESLESD